MACSDLPCPPDSPAVSSSSLPSVPVPECHGSGSVCLPGAPAPGEDTLPSVPESTDCFEVIPTLLMEYKDGTALKDVGIFTDFVPCTASVDPSFPPGDLGMTYHITWDRNTDIVTAVITRQDGNPPWNIEWGIDFSIDGVFFSPKAPLSSVGQAAICPPGVSTPQTLTYLKGASNYIKVYGNGRHCIFGTAGLMPELPAIWDFTLPSDDDAEATAVALIPTWTEDATDVLPAYRAAHDPNDGFAFRAVQYTVSTSGTREAAISLPIYIYRREIGQAEYALFQTVTLEGVTDSEGEISWTDRVPNEAPYETFVSLSLL